MFRLPSFFILFVMSSITCQEQHACNANAPCGCSYKSQIKPKIIGGETVRTRSWGWIVSIAHASDRKHFCGGSILSNFWILTAAHCVFDTDVFDIIINAGSNELNQYTQRRQAAKITIHPHFNIRTYMNDIALIQLSAPFDIINPDFAQICVPQQIDVPRSYSAHETIIHEYPMVNSTVVAVGWGQQSEDIRLSAEQLQEVTLQTVAYESITCRRHINSRLVQFCAGAPESNKDTCLGDSGGPLMQFISGRQWVIVGITSFGIGCGRAEYSGVYTRVSSYTNWINKTIDSLSRGTDSIFIVKDLRQFVTDISSCHYSFFQIFCVIMIHFFLLLI